MRKYDHIFFDLDHTLWDFPTNSRKAVKLTLEKHELMDQLPSFEDFIVVYEEVNEELWKGYRERTITKEQLTSVRFTRSLKPFKVKGFGGQQLNDCYLDFMGEQTALYPNALEILEYLKQKGYKMHIITNGFKEVQTRKLANSGLEKYFEKVFISEVVKAPKPDREIFEHAVKTVNAKKSKSIMIGDNWDVDIYGALNFGMDQVMCLLDGHGKLPQELEIDIDKIEPGFFIPQKKTNTFFVKGLTELKDLF